ncbi:MAG: DUF4838 domain-containing protein [Pedobacter sp.]|nr:MAG: DUF4838 domain-containing protein [Pedobacter sp.]
MNMILRSIFNIDFKFLGKSKVFELIFMVGILTSTGGLLSAKPIVLVNNSKSVYKIVLPKNATKLELNAAKILHDYLEKVTKASFPIINDNEPATNFEILIGKTSRTKANVFNGENELDIKSFASKIEINGSGDKGLLYGVYTFIETYLGCKMYEANFEKVPLKTTLTIPSGLNVREKGDFMYREVYYPYSKDQTYLNWHKLQRMDDHWGLWVHTFDKLVPARTYFKPHPEYFALVDGKRKDSQLCLSNPDVFKILTENLAQKIANEPTMKYWSVSQNDDSGYCECDLCSAVDRKEGGPQGSILKFVNKVAAKFPNQTISTLAYTYSQRAPITLKPAKNVQIMLCSIDCNRSVPIATDPRSAAFRRDLKNWSLLTNNLFVWDYNVQFTNYVSPFPNLRVLQANLKFFKNSGVKGVFLQGSGDTPGEFSALRAYLLAKLSWNVNVNVDELKNGFLADYYGKAAPFISKYIELLHNSSEASGRILDIYGSPVSSYRTYLSPELISRYGDYFDQAEQAVQKEPALLAHVATARLPIEFAVLQQAKFYGIEKHGAFFKGDDDKWATKPAIKRKVDAFVSTAKENGITELSEGGLSPNDYQQDWNGVITAGPKDHLALNAQVNVINPFSEEFINKGARTLTDGSRGYLDYQYNWLGWYGNDMEIVVDLGSETEIKLVSASFLEDQRHWAFPPTAVTYSFSADGIQFFNNEMVNAKNELYENYTKSVVNYDCVLKNPIKFRYIKVKAKNLTQLPPWRFYKNRKAWLFADEIMVR